MKVEVLRAFFDNNGLHKIGEIVEVEKVDENLMKPIKDAEKVVKKTTKSKE